MNPKPFSSLNHFTVPVAIFVPLRGMCTAKRGGCKRQQLRKREARLSVELMSDPWGECSDCHPSCPERRADFDDDVDEPCGAERAPHPVRAVRQLLPRP